MIAGVIRWSARNGFLALLATAFIVFAGIYAERRMAHGIDAGEDDKGRRQQHQKAIARGPADNAGDHGDLPSGAVKACRAARRLLSASIRKLAPVTTVSPSRTPSSTAA